MDIDANLDTLVSKVAKDLIDDYPANDPRWSNHRDLCNSNSSSFTETKTIPIQVSIAAHYFLAMTINAVTSMQIPNQLEGKQKALDLFIGFLKEHNLWNRVSCYVISNVLKKPN